MEIHATAAEGRRNVQPADRSIRPVIEHALTVYYDGNAELARALIDQLIAEQGAE